MVEYFRVQDGGRIRISVHTDLAILNEILGKLRGANNSPAHKVNGMFIRSEDLYTSCKRLLECFAAEAGLALDCIGQNNLSDNFHKMAESRNVKILSAYYPQTNEVYSFEGRELASLLRHFINDYCRVLEPLVRALAVAYPEINPLDRNKKYLVGFNVFVQRLEREGIRPFDFNVFYALYDELWNDYKHNESPGPQSTGWTITSEKITRSPVIRSTKNDYYRDIKVEVFVEKMLFTLGAVLDHIKLKVVDR